MEDGNPAESKPDLAHALKAAFARAKDEHGISRRAVAGAVYARQETAYQLRKRNAPSHALSALPSPPRSIHSWENLFLRWFANSDFPVKKDLEDILHALEERAPGSTGGHTRAQWLRIWQAGPAAPPDSASTVSADASDTASELSTAHPSRPAINQAGGDMIIHGGQYNASGDQTINNETERRSRKR